ncbi:hypothetical protein Hanom_Chr03g00218781 [Helianthus anomalus]
MSCSLFTIGITLWPSGAAAALDGGGGGGCCGVEGTTGSSPIGRVWIEWNWGR